MCVLEKMVHSDAIVWTILYVSDRFIWSSVVQVLCFSVALPSGCSVHYRNGSIEICYCYCVAVFFSRQFFDVCFIYLGALMLGLYVLVRSSWGADLSFII